MPHQSGLGFLDKTINVTLSLVEVSHKQINNYQKPTARG